MSVEVAELIHCKRVGVSSLDVYINLYQPLRCPLYLIKLLVVFLNEGFILHPDVHPETLLPTELPQTEGSVGGGGGGWVGLTVLQFPGLKSVV